MTSSDAITAITDVVRTYATAMVAGDRAELERIFFDNASEVGHYEGELLWNSRDAFIRMCEDEGNKSAKAWWTIRNLSIHGDIATAHVEDEWAGMRFDTILTLLLHDGSGGRSPRPIASSPDCSPGDSRSFRTSCMGCCYRYWSPACWAATRS